MDGNAENLMDIRAPGSIGFEPRPDFGGTQGFVQFYDTCQVVRAILMSGREQGEIERIQVPRE